MSWGVVYRARTRQISMCGPEIIGIKAVIVALNSSPNSIYSIIGVELVLYYLTFRVRLGIRFGLLFKEMILKGVINWEIDGLKLSDFCEINWGM